MLGTLGSSRRSWSDRSREIDRMKGQQPEIESRSYSMESSHPRDNLPCTGPRRELGTTSDSGRRPPQTPISRTPMSLLWKEAKDEDRYTFFRDSSGADVGV